MSPLFPSSPYFRSSRLTGTWDEVGIYYAVFEFKGSQRATRSSNTIGTKGEITRAGARSRLCRVCYGNYKHSGVLHASESSPFYFPPYRVLGRKLESLWEKMPMLSIIPLRQYITQHLASSLPSFDAVLQIYACLSIYSLNH